MTLVTAIALGLASGFFFGLQSTTLVGFAVIWLLVLVVQSTLVLDSDNVPPEDWVYVPVQAIIFAVGLAMIWLGSKLRASPHPPA